jgi:hypothetical protein
LTGEIEVCWVFVAGKLDSVKVTGQSVVPEGKPIRFRKNCDFCEQMQQTTDLESKAQFVLPFLPIENPNETQILGKITKH